MAITVELVKAILKPLHDAYTDNLAAGKMDAVAAFFSVDGVMVTKGKSCAYGRDKIKKELSELKGVSVDTTVSNEVYETTSDHIVYRSVFKSKVRGSGEEFGGNLEQIFRQEGGKWLCIHEELESPNIY